MRKLLLFLFVMFTLAFQVFAQNVDIPDLIFKDYLLNRTDINTNGDDEIQLNEANSLSTHITIVGLGISDLTGIESFTNLYNLTCRDNNLTSIDLSQNPSLFKLIIDNNQLEELDISNNTKLEHLYCNNNFIDKLDFSNNPLLKNIYCGDNLLSALDVSQLVRLEQLNYNNNSVNSIDFTNCPELILLHCSNNNISNIDINNNPKLKFLNCSFNKLNELDLSSNDSLKTVQCNDNKLGSLDFSNKPNLESIDCNFNILTDINLNNTPKLKGISCSDNLLTELNIQNNSNLELIHANNNQVEYLDISQHPFMVFFRIYSNKLTYLNIANGNNINIMTMAAHYNPDLECIIVDEDLDLENLPNNWVKDTQAVYNGNCCTATTSEITNYICEGESYTSPSGTQVFTEAGTYTDMLSNVGGCDSLITINLEVSTVDTEVSQDGNSLNAIATNATYQWVDCDNDNVAIEGATNQIFIPEANGSYAVLVGENACLDVSTCFEVTTVGTSNFIESNVKIYPNPTHEDIKIDLGNSYENVIITIQNTTGQLISKTNYGTTNQVDINIKSNGVYFLEIQTSEGFFISSKIVKI